MSSEEDETCVEKFDMASFSSTENSMLDGIDGDITHDTGLFKNPIMANYSDNNRSTFHSSSYPTNPYYRSHRHSQNNHGPTDGSGPTEPPLGPIIRVAKSRSRRKRPRDADFKESVVIFNLGAFLNNILRIIRLNKLLIFPDSKLWLVKDCCGIVCVIITYLLILYGQFGVLCIVLFPSFATSAANLINLFIFESCSWLALIAHLRSMLMDPGAIVRGNATLESIREMGFEEGQIIYKCPKCNSIKPDRTHHCSVCRRCIRKMDHHCPWINNCVGEDNLKFFILFCFYIFIVSIHGIGLAVHHLISCVGGWSRLCRYWSPTATVVCLVFIIVEGIIFMLFTGSMIYQQLDAIFTDETVVEQFKKDQPVESESNHFKPKTQSKWLNMKTVFGHPFSLAWFSPFHTPVLNSTSHYNGISSIGSV